VNSVADDLRHLLDSDPAEEEVHQFLASHSYLLRDLGFGVKRVFSKPAFGSDFKADFALAGWGNYIVWTFVELEAPHHKLFTKEGIIAKGLNKAIEQINSWWVWMYDYSEYAGDYYHDLSGDKTAAIVIGRRESLSESDTKRLKQLNATQLSGRLRIVTYDALLDQAEAMSQEEVESMQAVHERLTEFHSTREWREANHA